MILVESYSKSPSFAKTQIESIRSIWDLDYLQAKEWMDNCYKNFSNSNDCIVELIIRDLIKTNPVEISNCIKNITIFYMERTFSAAIPVGEKLPWVLYGSINRKLAYYSLVLLWNSELLHEKKHESINNIYTQVSLVSNSFSKEVSDIKEAIQNISFFDKSICTQIFKSTYNVEKFIVCHEVAHHLLGHTDGSKIGKERLEQIPTYIIEWWQKDPKNLFHKAELEADTLAFLLFAKGADSVADKDRKKFNQSVVYSCLLGLYQTTFSGENTDLENIKASHPHIFTRYINLVLLIVTFLPEMDIKEDLEFMIKHHQFFKDAVTPKHGIELWEATQSIVNLVLQSNGKTSIIFTN